MKSRNTSYLVKLSFFITLELALTFIPLLGFIPLGFINATTLHIPVILAGILLGARAGGIVGFVFGLLSVIKATLEPNLSSFIFSPFVTIGGVSGNITSLFIAFIPRILTGVVAGWLYSALKNRLTPRTAIGVAAGGASLTNTGLVLLGIYFLFGYEYAQMLNIATSALATYLLTIIATTGVVEAILAVLISIILVKALQPFFRR